MDQVPHNFHSRPSSRPSTPPFVTSDLKNFRSFFKSPGNNLSEQPEHDFKLNDFPEMDFESAYALLTQSPNFNQSFSPQAISQSELHEHFKEILFKSQTPSPKVPTPKVLSPVMDLEALQYFPKYEELLSVNESTALEQFLDSIMDDSKKTGSRSMSTQITDSEELQSGLSSQLGDPLTIPSLKHDQLLQPTQNSSPPPLPPPSMNRESSLEGENVKSRQSSISEIQQEKKQRKRRKLLSEEQKKLNHTTSEQRRRGMIKESFDDLVKILPLNHAKKSQSKSVVLETAASEIVRITKINEELKRLLAEHT